MNSETHRADWRVATYSNGSGACIEVATWRTASYSNGSGECVEVGQGDGVRVRDTKDHGGVALRVSAETWARFTATLR